MNVRGRSGALVLALLIGPAAASAQGDASAVFVVRVGSDTVAVERATIGPRRAEGVLRVRSSQQQVRQLVESDAAAVARHIVTMVGRGARGDSAAKQLEITVEGDSATAQPFDAAAPALLPAQRIAVPRGAVPFVNLSGLSVELMLRRARALVLDSATVPLLLGNGTSVPASVRIDADSATIVIAGILMRARTDAQGRLLGAVVPAQGVVFERLAGDAPAGAWAPARTSYAPPPGAPYDAEEIVLTTPSGIRLAGTITRPRSRPGVRLPAVVLITGSGSQDRDEATPAVPGYRPFREIADTLSRRGIVVLRLDDRGIGGSDAGPPTATSADFAADVRAAVAWLRAQPSVDPARVGLVGHSEGALIAPLVAVEDARLRAVALIAAPAERGRLILAEQQRVLLGGDSTLSPAQRDSVLAHAARLTDSLAAVPGWMQWFVRYDPLPAARRVHTPVLILQGETDRQVPAAQATTLAEAMRAAGNQRVTLRIFPRMNHLMLDDPSGDPRGYATLPTKTVRRDMLGALADWLAQML
jgi:alpha-beta hydrolase superfamily lysophospholipase